MRIGLIIIATGKYDIFLRPLIASAEKYFFVGEPYDVFIFTDKNNLALPSSRGNIKIKNIPHVPFPFATLNRYKYMRDNKEWLSSDNLYYIDADMLFAGDVGTEILPDDTGLVAVQHPGFYDGKWGSRNTPSESKAYVEPAKRKRYCCGGFQGGSHEAYLTAAENMWRNIEKDFITAKSIQYTKNSGILAEWHDETHWNRYLCDHPYKVLTPAYCYPQSWRLPFDKKIIALDKNHKEIRK